MFDFFFEMDFIHRVVWFLWLVPIGQIIVGLFIAVKAAKGKENG